MKSSTKRALSLLLATALFIAALAVYAVLIRPEYDIVQGLRGTLEAKSKILAETQNTIAAADNLKLEYQKDEKIIDSLSLALPEDEAISSLLAQLNALSRGSGLAIQSLGVIYLPIKPVAEKSSLVKGLGTLRLSLKLSGSYASFKEFSQGLENNLRIMDSQTVKIEHVAKPEQNLFNYEMNIDTYYQTK